jgi:hypothetical protein
LSVLVAGTSLGLFCLSTYLLGTQQRNMAESLSETASMTTVWLK